MRFACIRNGKIENVIVAEEDFIPKLREFQPHWEAVVRVDALKPEPGIGWTYKDGGFQAPLPEPVVLTTEQKLEARVAALESKAGIVVPKELGD